MKTSYYYNTLWRIILLPLAVFVAGLNVRAQSNYATPYTFATFAGLAGGPGSVDGTGGAARFDHPSNLARDSAGNLYVADTNNHTIRKVTPAGVVSTFAGTAGTPGSADGTGAAARFRAPTGVAVDASDTVFVADTGNYTIRKITTAGVVSTLAGTAGSSGSTDGTGSAARFSSPFAVGIDGSGNVFVADSYSHTIRKITSGGAVSTFAGTAYSSGSADGSGSAARFNYPTGLAVDGSGSVYVTDSYNQTLRKITSGGVVTTLAGTAGSVGSSDGTGSAARFSTPLSVTVDAAGTSYVADTNNNTIRKITSGGVVTTLAGTAGSVGSTDATGSAARFNAPAGITVDGAGNVYVSDTTNDTIRKITSGGVVTTLAGTAVINSVDGTGSAARFTLPVGLAVDGSGNFYVADSGNATIRKVTPGGTVTTLAGSAGNPGSADGTGTGAGFNYPLAVAVDAAGNVYVADGANATIRKITPGGAVTTLAGSAGSTGSTDGTGSAARFNYPSGVAVDTAGYVYVADAGNAAIRRITPGGAVTTFAGTAGSPGSSDGTAGAARFNYPSGVAVDAAGNVYVADAGNDTIRKITSSAVVTTLAGTPGSMGSTDGTGSAARFNSPTGVAVDASGNLFVSDTDNHVIRKITAAGVVTTLAGTAGSVGSADGTGSGVRFDYPHGIAVTGSGAVYLADTYNNTIRRGVPAVAVAGDFNSDHEKDIVWENRTTGDRALWLMHGTVFIGAASFGNVSTDWRIAAAADFNGDGKADILWENTVTGDRIVWLMDGTTHVSTIDMGIVPTVWRMAVAADFNGDGKTDIMTENMSTGERVLWLMDGTTVTSTISYGMIPPAWRIAGAVDFNHDGQIDIAWENTVTGDHALWMMNGTVFQSGINFGAIPTEWRLATVGDFNSDGNPDFFWENTVTGDHALWLMQGTVFSSSIYFGIFPTDWHIVP